MGDDIWTVRRILDWMEGYLGDHGDENPRFSSQWLVSDALDCTRMQLYLDMDRPLTLDEREVLRAYTRRRAAGEPLQYITGTTDFRYITLKVRKGVLIPRPETEVLVSAALSLLPEAPKPQDAYDEAIAKLYLQSMDQGESSDEVKAVEPSYGSHDAREQLVADICTGSGCIACSIASELPTARVIATDVSHEAFELATENVTDLGLEDRVEVVECDLGSGVSAETLGTFDLVVSNPPYVPSGELAAIPREVSEFEPSLALDGGVDGLVFFRRLLAWCQTALKPGAPFAFELHETCLDDASHEAIEAGYQNVRIIHDLADKPRVLVGYKPR